MISILTIYILIGLTLASVILSTEAHKNDSKLEKLLLFLTMTFFWPVGLFFPIHEKVGHTDGFIIEKLDAEHDVNKPVYPSDSFADGTSKFTVVDV